MWTIARVAQGKRNTYTGYRIPQISDSHVTSGIEIQLNRERHGFSSQLQLSGVPVWIFPVELEKPCRTGNIDRACLSSYHTTFSLTQSAGEPKTARKNGMTPIRFIIANAPLLPADQRGVRTVCSPMLAAVVYATDA
jgi:hypothetical protein